MECCVVDRSECILGLCGKTCKKATLIPKIRQENNVKTDLKNMVVGCEIHIPDSGQEMSRGHL